MSVEARRKQLVSLGVTFFTRQSYDVVAIDDIAKAAGISKGLLYHYFPTKRDFYVACVQESSHDLLTMTAPDATLPPEARLVQAIEAYLDYARRHAPAFSALLRGGVGADAEVAAIVEATRRQLVDRIALGVLGAPAEGAMLVALRGWLGYAEAASLEWLEQGAPDQATLRDWFIAMLSATLANLN